MAKSQLEIEIKGNIKEQTIAMAKALNMSLGDQGFKKLEQFATVNAARALAKPVRQNAPANTGNTAKAVRGRRSRINRPGAIVGPVQGKRGAWWSWFIVKGVRPHTIPKLTASDIRDVVIFGKERRVFEHPGVAGNDFVSQAVEANLNLAQDAFGATVIGLIDDAALRYKVMGWQVSYENGTAAQWQSKPYMRHWKNADYLEPIGQALKMPEGPDKVKAIAHGLKLKDAYNAQRGSAAVGVVPRVKRLRGI